jgi:hypothetical protein
MWLFCVGVALAQDEDDAPTPAPTTEPAPAPAAGAPTMADLRGTWWMTSQVEGKEAVAWACKGTPTSITFDGETLVLSAGAEPIGAAIRSTAPRGEVLGITTSIEACGGREMTARFVDPGRHIVELTRCEGAPRTIRVVRDVASGIPVMRQCCDSAGKPTGWTPTESPCRSGDGQKPTPLRR